MNVTYAPSVGVFVLWVVYNVSCSHSGFCNVNSVNVNYAIVFISGALLDSEINGLLILHEFKYCKWYFEQTNTSEKSVLALKACKFFEI